MHARTRPRADSIKTCNKQFDNLLVNWKTQFNFETFGIVLPTALAISLVGLMETFLTQDILDDMTDSNSNKNKEARGQGIANLISSFFGVYSAKKSWV